MKLSRCLCALLLFLAGSAQAQPPGFVAADQVIPDLVLEIRYFSERNFVGRPIDGYESPRALLSEPAAAALAKVQQDLRPFGLGLKVFDAYRPQRAVDHFVRWARDVADERMKSEYYPEVDKRNLFKEDYIAERSGHTRGSTVDVTLVNLSPPHQELDMGTGFDFFGVASWPDHPNLSPVQRAHRLLLRELMMKHGFRPYPKEWWHFTLDKEPWPDTYFDFPVR